VTEEQQKHKAAVITQAIARHRPDPKDPLAVLAAVGGFEIGGICGFLLGAAAARVPVVVDGFIASAGALLAAGLAPAVRDYLFLSHESAEPGHKVMAELLQVRPLLALEMRLGEGTGAALAMALIDSGLRLYREMATFESASVSNRAKA
jgi:nicotinate-nucleotide--dimethylbenzimidazole phosphoribosyltransferase